MPLKKRNEEKIRKIKIFNILGTEYDSANRRPIQLLFFEEQRANVQATQQRACAWYYLPFGEAVISL